MTDVVPPKRKADELEDPSVVDGENGLNKRAKKDDAEEVDETVEGTSTKDSEDDLQDDNEVTILEKDPVQTKRTRGVRVDYTEFKADDRDEGGDEDEDDEEEEDDKDAEEEAVGEGQIDAENDAVADKYVGENGTKGEQASEEEDNNDNDNYEDEEDEDEE